MVIMPKESELENIRCDILRYARHGEKFEIRGMALILKRLGCRFLIHQITTYIFENTQWDYFAGGLTSEDAQAQKLILENFN